MRNAAGQMTDRFGLLGLAQALVEPFYLGDVVKEPRPRHAPIGRAFGNRVAFDPDVAFLRVAHPKRRSPRDKILRRLGNRCAGAGQILGMDELEERLAFAQPFLFADAKNGFDRWADIGCVTGAILAALIRMDHALCGCCDPPLNALVFFGAMPCAVKPLAQQARENAVRDQYDPLEETDRPPARWHVP